jgi:hypothetical protein
LRKNFNLKNSIIIASRCGSFEFAKEEILKLSDQERISSNAIHMFMSAEDQDSGCEVNNCSAWNQEDRSEDSSVRKDSTEYHLQKIVFGLCVVRL